MKRTNYSPILFGLLFILALALSACVRPVPTPEVSPVPTSLPGQTTPEALPTAPPAIDPDIPTGYPGEATAVPDGSEGQPEATAVAPTADASTQGGGQATHTIQAGDTLFSIAEQYGTTVDAIVAANGITDPNNVPLGTVLVIPAPGEVVVPATAVPPTDGGSSGQEIVHTVQAGENLFRIGLAYGYTAAELAAYNGIPDPTRIYVGQQIRIPPN